MKQRLIYVIMFLLLAIVACKEDSEDIPDVPETDYNILVDINETRGTVSPLLMGFNTIYCFEKDNMWQAGQGQLPKMFKRLNTGILRYPGGAVVNRYHWNNLNGQGWMDNWAPNYNTNNDKPESDFMDVDEYMVNVTAIGAEPMIGINMGSGLKYNRVQDGIDEAVALVQYCKDKGYNVKYWYLDNEAYHTGANYQMTATEYADQINLYVPEMKKINPNIETVVNWDSKISTGSGAMETLISKAGANINIMEVHWYWQWGKSTFNLWLDDLPMSSKNQWYNGLSYMREILDFKPLVNSLGQGHIKLASNEWNLGDSPSGEEPSKFEAALMLSEQFSQFIDGGLFMANFWGVHWPNSDGSRMMLNESTDELSENSISTIFEMFGDAMGRMQVKCSSLDNGIYDIAVLNEETNELYIYLLNKTQDSEFLSTGIELSGVNVIDISATSFVEDKSNPGYAKTEELQVSVEEGNMLVLDLPKYSFTKIVVVQ